MPDVPATKIFAPAFRIRTAFCRLTLPSTSISASGFPFASRYARARAIFSIECGIIFCPAKQLTSELYVSEATVRSDLGKLARLGALKRTYVGATSTMETNRQVPLFVRESMNSFAKNEICRQAAELIQNGNTLFLDGSSTAQYIVSNAVIILPVLKKNARISRNSKLEGNTRLPNIRQEDTQ